METNLYINELQRKIDLGKEKSNINFYYDFFEPRITLKEEVKEIILYYTRGMDFEELKYWFDNSNNYNCSIGAVGKLAFYSNSKPFAVRHFDEIMESIKNAGLDKIPIDLNSIAWLGFQLTVEELRDEMLKEFNR